MLTVTLKNVKRKSFMLKSGYKFFEKLPKKTNNLFIDFYLYEKSREQQRPVFVSVHSVELPDQPT